MKLGNLVTTFENLAENEEPVPGPVGSAFPEGEDPTDALDLSDIPIDELPESAMTDLEVTMEEEIFKSEQITQQLNLLQDTMDVIKSTGVVTEAQQRIINIQLRGLEKHMPEQDRGMLHRYTSAPYDPATALVVSNEAFNVGLGLGVAAVVALVAIFGIMLKGYNGAATAIAGGIVKKGLETTREKAREVKKKEPKAILKSMTELPKEDQVSLSERISRSLSNLANSRGITPIDIMDLFQDFENERQIVAVSESARKYMARIAERTEELVEALGNSHVDIDGLLSSIEREFEEEVTSFIKNHATKLDSRIAVGLGGDPRHTYGVVYPSGLICVAFTSDDKFYMGNLRLSDGHETSGVKVTVGNFAALIDHNDKNTSSGLYRQLTENRRGATTTQKDLEDLVETIQKGRDAMSAHNRRIGSVFGKVGRMVKLYAKVFDIYVYDMTMNYPRAFDAAIRGAYRGSKVTNESRYFSEFMDDYTYGQPEITNEALGAGMSLAIAAILALAAVMAFMAKGMNTQAARAVSGSRISSAIKAQTAYVNISDKSKYATGTRDLPKEDQVKFQQAVGSALSWPCSFSGHEIIDLANVQKGRLVNFNVKYLGDAIYEFGNILNRHTDALSKALTSNDQAAVNAVVQELNSSTETFQTFLTTESKALSGSLARRLGIEGNSAVYGVSVIKGTFGYAFEVDLTTRRISKVNLGGLGEEMVRYSADSFDAVSKIEIKDVADGVGYEQIDKDRDLMLKASKSIESLANAAKDEIEALANGRAEINVAFGRAKDSIRTGVEMLGYIVNMTNIGIPRAVTAGLQIGLTPLKE